MKILNDSLILITNKYKNFIDMVDKLYYNDMYLFEDDTYYIHDSNSGEWYSIERAYHYGNLQQLFRGEVKICFYKIEDTEIIDNLMKTFYTI